MTMEQQGLLEPRSLAIVLMCAALNAGLAFLVQAFKLPIYLDLCGSLLCVALLGLRAGLLSAALGILVIGTITVPTNFAYIGTALGVTALAWYLLRFGFLKRLLPTVLGGIALGLLSAIMSAPVTAIVFGGVSLVGADAITALVRTTGANIMTSVFLGGVATDPVDKVLASLLAFSIYKALPPNLREAESSEKGPTGR
jgi:energy-coupling factor transport system substrate-specific component